MLYICNIAIKALYVKLTLHKVFISNKQKSPFVIDRLICGIATTIDLSRAIMVATAT